jgi:hypothetical protein
MYDSVAFRFIAANDHPDHDTVATLRRRFLKEIEGLFVQVLELALPASVPAPRGGAHSCFGPRFQSSDTLGHGRCLRVS